MPTKNLNIKYPEEYHGYTETEQVHALVDEVENHLCKVEVPEVGELQTEGLHYSKMGELVHVYGDCTPNTVIIAKSPYKPLLNEGVTSITSIGLKNSDKTCVKIGLTANGTIVSETAVRESLYINFTYITLD